MGSKCYLNSSIVDKEATDFRSRYDGIENMALLSGGSRIYITVKVSDQTIFSQQHFRVTIIFWKNCSIIGKVCPSATSEA
jgi:hypothetical protein